MQQGETDMAEWRKLIVQLERLFLPGDIKEKILNMADELYRGPRDLIRSYFMALWIRRRHLGEWTWLPIENVLNPDTGLFEVVHAWRKVFWLQ